MKKKKNGAHLKQSPLMGKLFLTKFTIKIDTSLYHVTSKLPDLD